jgi:acetyl esterase
MNTWIGVAPYGACCPNRMTPDPQMQAILDQMKAAGWRPTHTLSVAEARKAFTSRIAAGTPVARTQDRAIPGPAGDIPVRIHWPAGAGPFPALVFFHGGGWVVGNLDTHDVTCRSLTNLARSVTVSVDYRLAPEHKFPAAVEDAYAATCWVVDHAPELGVDPGRVAVGGASAGGNLATVVALIAIERGGPRLVFQLLIYPVTDAALDTPSAREIVSDDYPLNRADMEWFWNHYLRDDADRRHPQASPARAKSLAGLPAALVITAEIDPLCDEGERYAAALAQAGVTASFTRYQGVTHGFVGMEAMLDKGRAAVTEAAQALRAAFLRFQLL